VRKGVLQGALPKFQWFLVRVRLDSKPLETLVYGSEDGLLIQCETGHMEIDKELGLPGGLGAVAFKEHHVTVEFFLKLRSDLFNLSKGLTPGDGGETVVDGGRNEREKGI